jgi:hypothetical protein
MKYFILIILTSISFCIHSQSLNCAQFKNGTFKIAADARSGETILVRNGNTQIETNQNTKESSEFTVKWIDDCTYTLTPTKKTLEKYSNMPENACLTVKITAVKKNSYLQTSTSNFSDFVMNCEVIKIK